MSDHQNPAFAEPQSAPTLSSLAELMAYASTLSSIEDTGKIFLRVFPAVYALALSELEQEAVFKTVSKACGSTLGAIRHDWKIFHKTRPEEQNRPQDLNQADRLVKVALERLTLFHDQDGKTYADLERDGHRETYRLRGKDFKEWLAREFYEAEGKAPSSMAISDALGVLEGKAKFDGPEHRVYVRIAPLTVESSLKMYLDLGDKDWQVVEVDSSGWRLMVNPPVRFYRPKTSQALLAPIHGGQMSDLMACLNIAPESFNLLVCWLVGALNPKGPYVLLEIIGGQGTSKSTTAKFIKRLIDPSSADLRTLPRSEEDLMIAAQGQHIPCYDNASSIPIWLSDSFCRLATGGGLSKRELFSDDGEVTLEAMRPVIITGITDLATRPDLLDRTIRIELPLIPPSQRRPLEEVEEAFTRVAPRVLGVLLDGVSMALRDRIAVAKDMKELPRMADFAVWVTAAEPALGITRGEFVKDYAENRAQSDNAALEANPVPPKLVEFMTGREDWTGVPKALLEALEATLHTTKDGKPKKPKGWPETPKALSDLLKRYGPVLRSAALLEIESLKRITSGLPLRISHLVPHIKSAKSSTSSTSSTFERTGQQKPHVHDDVHGLAHVHEVHPMYIPKYMEENTIQDTINTTRDTSNVLDVHAQQTLNMSNESETQGIMGFEEREEISFDD